MRLATNLAWVMLLVLSAVTALSILLSPVVVPLLTGKLDAQNTQLAVHLTQVMFPVVVLLGINGLLVGILNAEDHFTIPALSPVIWNLLIMGFMVGAHVAFDDQATQIYGYAIGVLIGTIAQLLMAIPLVRASGFRLGRPQWRVTPEVRQVLLLMLPVAIGLGLVNFNLVINTTLGFAINDNVPRAIDAAFRLYMLPQGIFSVAIATVLFPALSRAAARADHADLRSIIGDGMRQILVLLIPAAALSIALAAPITRLAFERGDFTAYSTELASEALWVFSLTLPLNGLNLLLTRTFFALKDPWTTTRLAVLSLAVNVAVSVALYKPLGIAGIVAGTVAANVAVVAAQTRVLRGRLGGSLGLAQTGTTALKILAAALLLAAAAVGVDAGVRELVGSGTLGLAISLTAALAVSGAVYLAALRVCASTRRSGLSRCSAPASVANAGRSFCARFGPLSGSLATQNGRRPRRPLVLCRVWPAERVVGDTEGSTGLARGGAVADEPACEAHHRGDGEDGRPRADLVAEHVRERKEREVERD